jgi:hypothetical protein
MESQEPYGNSEGRKGNKQTNANLPNDNDSGASLVQLQVSNVFSLGVPTYLPTYNSSMLTLSPKPSSSSFKISVNHGCIDWTRITKRSSCHVQRPHKLYNRTAASKFDNGWE